MLTGDKK
jgi:phospholipid-transporting ATPase